MFKVCTHYLNDNRDMLVYDCDFDDYKEAMTYYAHEIVANDSTVNGRNVVAMGFDYINVSLWKVAVSTCRNERLAHWSKSFF